MGRYDAYVNIAGGMKMNEPALDLAIVMALVSSLKDPPVSHKTIVFGEVGCLENGESGFCGRTESE